MLIHKNQPSGISLTDSKVILNFKGSKNGAGFSSTIILVIFTKAIFFEYKCFLYNLISVQKNAEIFEYIIIYFQ